MSVQFGRWNFDGQPPEKGYIETVSAALAPYGPDSNDSYSHGGIAILYRAFHTTEEAHREMQPHISPSGTVIAWDGRLDNRTDLISKLRAAVTMNSTDVAVIAAAYEEWGSNCFSKLIGDWALSIWNPASRTLILAKDPLGARHLYYSFDENAITWSTILDPLVLSAGRTFELCEEYIAGWFSYFPSAHLTPYLGILSVPPSSYALVRPGHHVVSKYWDFDPEKRIHYGADAQYEEHFRDVFSQAVHRRLRSDRPVLAELSGGLDSASIVCMADKDIARGGSETPRLDTISWFDDSYDHIEPDSNELHWITKVEEKRGRIGYHIDLSSLSKDANSGRELAPELSKHRFAATPRLNLELPEHCKRYAAHMFSHGYRVTLSGIGGDEVTSGDVPTPRPALQNLLARGHFVELVRQLNAWASKMKTSRISLLREAIRGFLTLRTTGVSPHMRPASWHRSEFVRRNYSALCGYPSRLKLLGPLPSFQENLAALNVLRRLLANWPAQPDFLREVRFPYLDRDFLEFMYAIPREQVVGVGKRRFLMKRALAGIVPTELLNRRRKAFVPEVPKKGGSSTWPHSAEVDKYKVSSSFGIIDEVRLEEALQKGHLNKDHLPIDILRNPATLEAWLRHLISRGVLINSMCTTRESRSCVYR